MKLLLILLGIVFGYFWSYQANVVNQRQVNEFQQVPTNQLHTMRVYEDGGYSINYKDGTGEVGCLSNSLCED